MSRYDNIGIGYDDTRKADPFLASRMRALLQPKAEAVYLEVGCGTGNYTIALSNSGMRMIGIEPSDQMISVARSKSEDVEWIKGTAEDIPLETDSIDGVLLSLTIHHWKDLDKGMQAVKRVMKPNGRLVLFTSLPEQTGAYWLKHYFPQMIEDSAEKLPRLERIYQALDAAGLEVIESELYNVQPDLKDLFLYSGKHDPERYFDPDIRKGISSFSLLAHQSEVESGLEELRSDIDSGNVWEVIKAHENDRGDYVFLVVQ